jgi:hypothetical protein
MVINATSGLISGRIITSVTIGSHSFTVTATDANGYTATANYAITVIAPTFTFSPTATALPNGVLGYSQQITASSLLSGDTFTYAVTSGSLPTGFSLSSSGLITAGGSLGLLTTYNFTITATDQNGYTGSKAYSITIVLVL